MGPEVDIRANQGHLWDKGMGFQEHTSQGEVDLGKAEGWGGCTVRGRPKSVSPHGDSHQLGTAWNQTS